MMQLSNTANTSAAWAPVRFHHEAVKNISQNSQWGIALDADSILVER